MKKTLYIFVVAGFISSCNKFLDIVPKGKDTPSTLAQYNGLMNNTNLINLSGTRKNADGSETSTGVVTASVAMGDDYIASPVYLEQLGMKAINGYKWDAQLYLPSDDAPEWGAFYSQIYNYNLIANNVMATPDTAITKKKAILAEARIGRAYMHFMLANYFGKPYNPATSATDPAVPLVTVADVTQTNFRRSTVQEIYDFVLREILESVNDLPDQTQNRLRMGKAAGYYILGQVYLYMAKYEDAKGALVKSMDYTKNSSITLQLFNYNTKMSEWYNPALPAFGASSYPTLQQSDEVIYLKQVILLDYVFSNTCGISPATMALFDPADQRLKFFYNRTFMSGVSELPYFSRTAPYSVNYGADMTGLFLMLAECKARTGDLSGAINDIQTFRQSRMPATIAAVNISDADMLIKFIIDERKREYAGTGLRWFDMRRLSNDPLFKNVTYTHTYGTETFTLTPERMVLRIPAKILNQNPNMQDNP
ncbi:SusD-like starch-binding protein associating with outer membrane [Chitinophaga dinghuensis]|uniref:SusD-like starch-binding protein associating with outer membrane n=1 Tax=Chitinophaga dinghuensis TaxID=1539050 RepID=A0A327VXY5_9BACT|nr:RagB/SusD family nutrient uptake outer membrane protein [Chitinophaga dinghuensis]RAJ81839.1 SusD-like starch-binding protein associating with outer membrane [Chitinophaga dinghuensis]